MTQQKSRCELAEEYFVSGYNCAQSVTLAFSDLTGMDASELACMVSPFGGGFGRLREVCGAFSGITFINGMLYGYDTPEAKDAKAELYGRIQELGRSFEEKNGSLICRELLGLSEKHDSPIPEARTADYYDNRPCKGIVGKAAQILDDYLSANR